MSYAAQSKQKIRGNLELQPPSGRFFPHLGGARQSSHITNKAQHSPPDPNARHPACPKPSTQPDEGPRKPTTPPLPKPHFPEKPQHVKTDLFTSPMNTTSPTRHPAVPCPGETNKTINPPAAGQGLGKNYLAP